jgi:hypothetical protein
MNANTMIAAAAAVALGTLGVAAPASAQQASSDDVAGLVKSVMDATYGQNYDAKNACWVRCRVAARQRLALRTTS